MSDFESTAHAHMRRALSETRERQEQRCAGQAEERARIVCIIREEAAQAHATTAEILLRIAKRIEDECV